MKNNSKYSKSMIVFTFSRRSLLQLKAVNLISIYLKQLSQGCGKSDYKAANFPHVLDTLG